MADRVQAIHQAISTMIEKANAEAHFAVFSVDVHAGDEWTKLHRSGVAPAQVDWQERGVYFACDPEAMATMASPGVLSDPEFDEFVDATLAWWSYTVIPVSDGMSHETMLLGFSVEKPREWFIMSRLGASWGVTTEEFLFGTDET